MSKNAKGFLGLTIGKKTLSRLQIFGEGQKVVGECQHFPEGQDQVVPEWLKGGET